MSNEGQFPSGANVFRPPARKPIKISAGELVEVRFLPGFDSLPLVVTPAVPQVSLVEWAKNNRQFIEKNLLQYGAILFRGFGVNSVSLFESFAAATSDDGLLDYRYCSTPRTHINGGVYTSTEYPADQIIPFHNEMSYSLAWPMKIWFCCLKPSATGGATPIAHSVKVFNRLSSELKARFQGGVQYVRNYGSGWDLSCKQVFGSDDPEEIERLCQDASIECEWTAPGKLKTRQRCQAIAVHPRSKKTVWFNQAHLFHISSLNQNVAAEFMAEFGEQNLPRNSYFADGTSIDESSLAEIRQAYEEEKVAFSWHEGDVLMVDNMLVAHGREAFSGERRIVVAMAEQHISDFPHRFKVHSVVA